MHKAGDEDPWYEAIPIQNTLICTLKKNLVQSVCKQTIYPSSPLININELMHMIYQPGTFTLSCLYLLFYFTICLNTF